MQATKPILIEKPKGESNLALNQAKEYKLISSEKEYLIQLGKTSSNERIGFKIKEVSSEAKIFYGKYLSLEELQKISKSFRVFDNIDEALTSIEDLFQESNASIKSENENLYINLQINKVGKVKEIVEIKLDKRAFSLKEMNEKLENDVKNLKIEIEEIKNCNKNLKEEIKYLKDKIENNNPNEKNEINNLKKEIELLKKELGILSTNGKQTQNKISIINKINSEIINKKEELDFIENRLKYMEQFKNKNLSYNLIFRGTRDGKLPSDFHNKVDGKDKTITIIETTKGLKFGGYIDKKWDSSSGWIKDDENCFAFSLSLMKNYNPIKNKNKYFFRSNFGPNFSIFGLRNNLFEKSSLNIRTMKDAHYRFSGFESDYELTGGEDAFQVKELEVFQIGNK